MTVGVGSRLGRYFLLELLGTGGMAEVWRARLEGPGGFSRIVVLKRLLPHLARDEGLVKLFFSEARLSSLLQHPNIVPVFELGHEDGWYFMTMEHLRGCDLSRVLAHMKGKAPPRGLGMAAYTVREVCRALAYAHGFVGDDGQALRIVHRDVSPSNVMLTRDGAVKLLDFGIAKALALTDGLTEPGTMRGKAGYVSPQQARGEPIDHRADLFAAGVVLHELLTARRLFKGVDGYATLELVARAEIEPPSAKNPRVNERLDAICMRALARAVEDRYQSAAEMADDLDREVDRLEWGEAESAALVLDVLGPVSTTPDPAAETTPSTPAAPLSAHTPTPAPYARPSAPPLASARLTAPAPAGSVSPALVALAILVIAVAGTAAFWLARSRAVLAPIAAPSPTAVLPPPSPIAEVPSPSPTAEVPPPSPIAEVPKHTPTPTRTRKATARPGGRHGKTVDLESPLPPE